MKLNRNLLFAMPLIAAAFGLTGTSFASPLTFNGAVYENQAAYPASLTPPTTPASATFQVTGLQFETGDKGFSYTIGGFLNSYGDLVAGSFSNTALLGDTMNDTTFEFTGSSYFKNGQSYTVRHDDGTILTIGGVKYINSASPTAASDSTFIYTGASGVQNVDLLYAEVNGAPGVLTTAIAPTPEPSTMVLLGTGLVSAAGMIRRRIRA